MKELIAKLKFERDRLYTLWCSGTRHKVEQHVRGEQLADVINEAMTALASMPAWVKCEERLPARAGEVLVVFDDDLVMEADYCTDRESFLEYNPRSGQYTSVPGVSHWMPLPAPPIQQEG